MSAKGTDPSPGAAGGLRVRGRATHAPQPTPMRVLALAPAGGTLARCAGVDGIPHTVETVLLGPLDAGAIVLVQAGLALVRLDAEWAL